MRWYERFTGWLKRQWNIRFGDAAGGKCVIVSRWWEAESFDKYNTARLATFGDLHENMVIAAHAGTDWTKVKGGVLKIEDHPCRWESVVRSKRFILVLEMTE